MPRNVFQKADHVTKLNNNSVPTRPQMALQTPIKDC